jgi:MOSC domain-containing protein YiiM
MAEVLHLFLCQVHRFPMKEVEEAEAICDQGMRGCIHGRRGSSRQVLLMDSETLRNLGLAPGTVKENITTRGLDFQKLSLGQVLRISNVILRISGPCDPCPRMDDIRMGLQAQLEGQRGWLCRVIEGGTIRRGDAIEVLGAMEQVEPTGVLKAAVERST